MNFNHAMIYSRDVARALTFYKDRLALGDVSGQDLDGDGPVEPSVTRLVHFAHAARAEGREDFVGTEFVTIRHRHWENTKSV